MFSFSEYIQPVSYWLHSHPHWALFFTFLISFAESLAIVGSIIPGSVTMTAIGILAGSGVMPIDLTLLAATLGAVFGDSVSYMLGYTFSDRLATIWPFSRYPQWLIYGKDFFAKHGGKSVLIGRFVGPLRSIIPVIAGMMHMSHLHFYVANILSAIAWSLLYVLPGVLIGAASNELAPEIATKLFVLVLLMLGVVWAVTLILKWIIIRANQFLKVHLHDFWAWSRRHPQLARFFDYITPIGETNHYATASMVLLSILSFISFCIITLIVMQQSWILTVHQPVHLVLQSIRTAAFDSFFIVSAQLCSSLTVLTLSLSILIFCVYSRDWRSVKYWLSLIASCTVLLYLSRWLIDSQRPVGLMNVKPGNSYPAMQLTYATAIFLSLLFYINNLGKTRLKPFLNAFLPTILLFAGLAEVYLGDHWLADIAGAYLAGASICLIHWLFYRRKKSSIVYSPLLTPTLLVILLLASLVSCFMNYNQEIRNHQPYFAQYVFTDKLWWNQKKPLLPLYRVNRLGQPVNLFNIQYAGSVSRLEASLSAFGWQRQNESLYQSILNRLSGHPAYKELPIMAQLYLNHKPILVMTYKQKNGGPTLVLRLWRSNYHLQHYRQPLWIGSVHPRNATNYKVQLANKKINPPLFYIRMALSEYLQREIFLSGRKTDKLPIHIEPKLLLIKELPPLELFRHTLYSSINNKELNTLNL